MDHSMHHHTVFGFCWWDLPALLILIAIVVFLIIRHRRMKKREEELESLIEEKYLNDDNPELSKELEY